MSPKSSRMMSDESGASFVECTGVLRKAHETLSKETGDASVALFDAIRIHMIAAAAYLARNGKGTDEDMRTILHNLLELGINDYQFNERLYVGSKGAS